MGFTCFIFIFSVDVSVPKIGSYHTHYNPTDFFNACQSTETTHIAYFSVICYALLCFALFYFASPYLALVCFTLLCFIFLLGESRQVGRRATATDDLAWLRSTSFCFARQVSASGTATSGIGQKR